ncbi:MAG TPA: hypothetical protein VF636_01075 [Sphingomonas sp.]|jgi:hypothetical protein
MIRPSHLLALLLAAGCARQEGTYPSLAIRPIERLGFEEPDPKPARPPVADPALDARLGEVGAALAESAAEFSAAAGRAETAAARARGAAAGSEPWLEAQVALGELDVLRAATSERFTDVAELVVARATTLQGEYPALTALQAEARAELDRQQALIRRLTGALAPAD